MRVLTRLLCFAAASAVSSALVAPPALPAQADTAPPAATIAPAAAETSEEAAFDWDAQRLPIPGRVVSGKLAVVLPDGTVLDVPAKDLDECWITADRQHIVGYRGETAVYMNADGTDLHEFPNVGPVDSFRNDGMICSMSGGEMSSSITRILFADSSALTIKDAGFFACADHSVTMVYLTYPNMGTSVEAYLLTADSQKAQKLDELTYTDDCEISVSDDGRLCKISDNYWDATIYSGTEKIPYSAPEGTSAAAAYACFSADQKICLIYGYNRNSVYLWQDGKGELIDLGCSVESDRILTNAGDLTRRNVSEVENLYLLTQSEDGKQSYLCLSLDGKAESLSLALTGTRCSIGNGFIAYALDDDTKNESQLYYAPLTGSQVGTPVSLGSMNLYEVTMPFWLAEGTDTLYYTTSAKDAMTLNAVKMETGEKEMISGALPRNMVPGDTAFYVGTDGESVFYFADGGNKDTFFKDLYVWTSADGKTACVDKNVEVTSLSSGLISAYTMRGRPEHPAELDPNGFYYIHKTWSGNTQMFTGSLTGSEEILTDDYTIPRQF